MEQPGQFVGEYSGFWNSLYRNRSLVIFGLNVSLLCFAILASIGIHLTNATFSPTSVQFWGLVFISLLVKFPVLHLANLNTRSWRFTGVEDAWLIVKVAALSELIFFALIAVSVWASTTPLAVFATDFAFTVLFLAGGRLAFRTWYETNLARDEKRYVQKKRVLIVGAGEAGVTLARKLRLNSNLKTQVVGFVDDSWHKRGMKFGGVPVLGRVSDLTSLVASKSISEIYIAIPSIKKADLKRITNTCISARVSFKTLPPLREILEKGWKVDQLREVKVEDLLGREPIQLDKTCTRQEIEGQVILVTGAGGSIGSELCRQIISFRPKCLLMLERSEYNLFHIERELLRDFKDVQLVPLVGDILDETDLDAIFQQYKPSIVYHAAAYKHVPLMEDRPREAIKNNVFGTKVLSDIAIRHQVKKFVMISTDKAVRPLSIMGYSKRLAEIVVQSRAGQGTTAFMSVRFGNVLGSSGSVVEVFRRQLQEGGPLTVTHKDARRFFMTTPEAVELVLHAGSHGQNGAIYMLNMGEAIKIVELAQRMIELADPEGSRGMDIEISGLRPGEKLTEELLWEGEDIVPSGIEHVSMLKTRVRIRGLDARLKTLEKNLQSIDSDMEFELKSLVTTIDHSSNISVVPEASHLREVPASEPVSEIRSNFATP